MQIIEHPFPDHHAFTPQDILFNDNHIAIMTEKDAVKCQLFATEQHWYLPVVAQCNLDFYARVRELLHEAMLRKSSYLIQGKT